MDVKIKPGESSYWCTCGRHWPAAPETAEIDPPRALFSIMVPEPEIAINSSPTSKANRTRDVYVSNRKVYLEYNGLTEADVLTDKDGNEYWIKEDEETGEFTYKYIPKRYKRGNGGYTNWF